MGIEPIRGGTLHTTVLKTARHTSHPPTSVYVKVLYQKLSADTIILIAEKDNSTI